MMCCLKPGPQDTKIQCFTPSLTAKDMKDNPSRRAVIRLTLVKSRVLQSRGLKKKGHGGPFRLVYHQRDSCSRSSEVQLGLVVEPKDLFGWTQGARDHTSEIDYARAVHKDLWATEEFCLGIFKCLRLRTLGLQI